MPTNNATRRLPGVKLVPETTQAIATYGSSMRTVRVGSMHNAPDGVSDLGVEIEAFVRESDPSRHREYSRALVIDITYTGGPVGGHSSGSGIVPFEIWPNDLAPLLACLVTAAHIGQRDGVLPPITTESKAVLDALYAALSGVAVEG